MDKLFAKRMDELVPSGIRKVNEKALAMERAGETVIHFELQPCFHPCRVPLTRRRLLHATRRR